jgi:hypothetical protein
LTRTALRAYTAAVCSQLTAPCSNSPPSRCHCFGGCGGLAEFFLCWFPGSSINLSLPFTRNKLCSSSFLPSAAFLFHYAVNLRLVPFQSRVRAVPDCYIARLKLAHSSRSRASQKCGLTTPRTHILTNAATVPFDGQAAEVIARRCRKTPRTALDLPDGLRHRPGGHLPDSRVDGKKAKRADIRNLNHPRPQR